MASFVPSPMTRAFLLCANGLVKLTPFKNRMIGAKDYLNDLTLLLEDGLHGRLVLCRKIESALIKARGALQPEFNALPNNQN